MKKSRLLFTAFVACMVLCAAFVFAACVTGGGDKGSGNGNSNKSETIFLIDCSYSTKDLRGATGNPGEYRAMDKFLKEAFDIAVKGNCAVGIVAFGYGAPKSTGLSTSAANVFSDYSSLLYVGELFESPLADGTDIENAILTAEEMFTKDASGKIVNGRAVILSDGGQTDGKALPAAARAANRGMRIDTVYFEPPLNSNRAEVQINALTVRQSSLKKGDTADIVVDIGATAAAAGNATVTLSWASINPDTMAAGAEHAIKKDGHEVAPVVLSGDGARISYQHAFGHFGLLRLKAEVSRAGDGIEQNNTYYTFVNVLPGDKILIIDGIIGGADALSDLIGDEYRVTTLPTNRANGLGIEQLREYDEVFLMNADPKELSMDFMGILDEYVYKYGGGLITTGGDNMYNPRQVDPKDYFYSAQAVALEKMLPVDFDPNGQPLALVLVVDASTSMAAPIRPSGPNKPYDGDMIGSRLWAAAESCKAAVNALAGDDYVGIIKFNSSARQVIGMTPVSRKAEIFTAIENISTSQGCIYNQGVTAAANMMAGVTFTERKHVIFITDGLPMDGDANMEWTVNSTIRSMKRNGITFSTVGIGNELDRADARQILQSMADDGWGMPTTEPRYGNYPGAGNESGPNGRHFLGIRDIAPNFQNDTRVTDFMTKEVEELTPVWKNDWSGNPIGVEVIIKSHDSSVLSNVSAFPKLGGFYGVKAKAGDPGDPPEMSGKVILATPDGYPIYAEWNYGAGRVASFMSTLNGDIYSARYVGATAEPGGKTFAMNVVKSMMEDKPVNLERDVVFNSDGNENFKTQFRIRGLEANLVGLSIKVYGQDLRNTGVAVTDLARLGTDTFGGSFETLTPGIYRLEITNRGKTEAIAYYAFSYSREYNAFPDAPYRLSCKALMDKLRSPGGKAYLPSSGGAAVFG
ncbi:MAG: VWA domain-containing protein [Firmicutes bacterium]|nr:VWA domain-containing protein [Bacillota bacterium]